MSFYSKDSQTLKQQLKVQEVVVSSADSGMVSSSGGHSYIQIGEAIESVISVVHCDDSGPSVALIPAASVTIVDSSALTAGGDEKAIKVASTVLASGDSFQVKFVVQD